MRSLLSGLWLGLAGALCGLLLFFHAEGTGWQLMILVSGLASLAVGTFLWWSLVHRHDRNTVRMGAVAGALTGLLAHPVAWYFSIVATYVSGVRSSLGDEPLDPLTGLWGALVLSLASWILVGWLTAIVGGCVGAFIAATRRKKGR